MLTPDVLLPIRSKIPNPLTALFSEFETKAETESEWLKTAWPEIKRALLFRCLNKQPGLFFVKGLKVPSDLIQDGVLEMYTAINGSVYFSVEFRLAFLHWLKFNQIDPKYPQFREPEVFTALLLLTQEEISVLRQEAENEVTNIFADRFRLNLIFKTIQKSLKFLSKKRVGLLAKEDAALYSAEDICQQLNLQILLHLKNVDQINKNEIGWAITIAKNCLRDLINKSNIQSIKTEPIDEKIEDRLADVIYSLTVEDKCFFESILARADERMQVYLRFVWGEVDIDFWEWFCFNEPELAQKEVYQQQQPQAILPWVQRWLGLGTYEIVDFFKEHYPELNLSSQKRA